MRKLKHHEAKLLRKLNFLVWLREGSHRENVIIQRYHLTEGDDYKKYSSMCRMVQKLVSTVKQMDPKDPFQVDMTDKLLEKLYNMGVIPTRQSITLCERLTVSSFCRGMFELVQIQLQIQLSLLLETWKTSLRGWIHPNSKIQRKVLQYNDKLDDYDLMN
ncbi:hypothetical protein P8452_58450 [Trifolium repens]|nr:hypothetical protein P8452_58450 [Trifolium repens]